MIMPKANDAAPQGKNARRRDHAVPLFDGRQSRTHIRRSIMLLRATALGLSLRHRRTLADARTFVQFAGWPRSGHSLIGALIDAHPDAAIAHELDAMGLFHKGMMPRRIAALCLGNAAAFTVEGRYWNGYSYAVPGAPHGPDSTLTVIGDKKGDWATRWSALNPDLVGRFASKSPFRSRWILVTRHPADNIATMSLRMGRHYDKLRIAHSGPIGTAIADAQAKGDIANAASDAMIADYRALATTIAAMKKRVPAAQWHEINYEDFVDDPRTGLADLATFLDLDIRDDWLEGAAAIVGKKPSRSRDRVSWREDQRETVARTIRSYDFLTTYRDDH